MNIRNSRLSPIAKVHFKAFILYWNFNFKIAKMYTNYPFQAQICFKNVYQYDRAIYFWLLDTCLGFFWWTECTLYTMYIIVSDKC